MCVTYYLQTDRFTFEVFIASLACGFVIDTLLLVNNYRDIDNDARAGKKTLIVRVGAEAGRTAYLCSGIMALVFGVAFCSKDTSVRSCFLSFISYLITRLTARWCV